MPYLNRIAISASEERLEQLIEARLAPGADQRAIDVAPPGAREAFRVAFGR